MSEHWLANNQLMRHELTYGFPGLLSLINTWEVKAWQQVNVGQPCLSKPLQMCNSCRILSKYGLYIVSCGFHAYFDMDVAQCHYLWTYKTWQLDQGNGVYLLCKCQVTSSYNRVDSLIWYAGWEHAHIRKITNACCMDAKIDDQKRSPIFSQLSLRNKSIICTWNLWCAAHKWQCRWNIQVLASHLQVLPSLLGQFAHLPCQLWEIVLHWQRACTVHKVLLNQKKRVLLRLQMWWQTNSRLFCLSWWASDSMEQEQEWETMITPCWR